MKVEVLNPIPIRFMHILLISLFFLSSSSSAQTISDGYPNKPIKLVITWPVGGFADILGRTLATQLGPILGQQIIVENKGGANGMIGADAVAKSPADGYTLMFQSVTSHGTNPAMYSKTPYSTEKDIQPLAVIASVPLMLVANPNFPAKSIAELIALSKKQPDSISYASFGNGSASHLAGVLFAEQAGIKLTHIPYKGGAPAITDTIGGQVPLSFSAFGLALPHVKTGKLVPLGTTGSLRAKPLPDVPAIGEGGILKGYEMTIVYAVWAPTGLPSAVNNRLSKAIEQVVNSNAFREKLVGDGGEIMTIFSQSESQAYFQKELARLGKIVRDGNIRAD